MLMAFLASTSVNAVELRPSVQWVLFRLTIGMLMKLVSKLNLQCKVAPTTPGSFSGCLRCAGAWRATVLAGNRPRDTLLAGEHYNH